MTWKVVFLFVAAVVSAEDPSPTRLIGYFDAKSQKELPVESLPSQNLTHVVLTNAVKVDSLGKLYYLSEPDELSSQELFKRISAMPVQLIVSIRGHEDDVALDELSENETVRTRFASDMAKNLQDWGASGLEIEWHSDDPAGGKAVMQPFDQMEQYHFALLCKDLAESVHPSNKTLSVAVRPGRQEFHSGNFVNKYVDWLALRAYSMRSLGDPHHSSLKDMHVALCEWETKNASKKKLVVATALFARPGAALHSKDDRNEALRLSWKELSSGHRVPPRGDRRGDVFRDIETGKAWWVSGVNTTRDKVKHVLEGGYGGLALRDLHHDSTGDLSIVKAAADEVQEYKAKMSRRSFLAKPMSLLQKGLKRSRTAGTENKYAEL